MRLDDLLVQRGLADSKTCAKGWILGGKVRSGTTILDKAGQSVPVDIPLAVESPPRYVSRAAGKLEGFFAQHPTDLCGWSCLDIGASTGGFTDYLLQAGAARVVCVDVGHGQLHYKLQRDPRVENIERLNARFLEAKDLPIPEYDLVVMDVSFISITQILPRLWPLIREGGVLVTLIKPQFEAGKEEADKGRGVIRDAAVRERILREILTFAEENLSRSELIGHLPSPVTGTSGNQEFLAGWRKGDS